MARKYYLVQMQTIIENDKEHSFPECLPDFYIFNKLKELLLDETTPVFKADIFTRNDRQEVIYKITPVRKVHKKFVRDQELKHLW